MNHLSEREFIDLLDGQLPPSRAAHVEACAGCREQVESTRVARTLALEDRAPEPSPLFWERFPARVRGALHTADPTPRAPWTAWLRRPAIVWAGGAMLAILVLATVLVRPPAPAPVSPATAAASDWSPSARAAADLRDDMEADAAWAIVRSVAEDMDWDDAHAAGLSARPGSAEMVVLELSDEERAALARLLEIELRRQGA
jgi:hypothetical protein